MYNVSIDFLAAISVTAMICSLLHWPYECASVTPFSITISFARTHAHQTERKKKEFLLAVIILAYCRYNVDKRMPTVLMEWRFYI